ncbi:MAG: hypothetical protein EOP06_00350 [Proteobacteria bacterium]|nr:MAG: hypothetical protein EOP06_00350 [Pseudomonadota bacterium]
MKVLVNFSFLTTHQPNCPICEGNRWEVGRLDRIELRLTPDRIGGEPPKDPKHIHVECAKCGYTYTFRLQILLEKNV